MKITVEPQNVCSGCRWVGDATAVQARAKTVVRLREDQETGELRSVHIPDHLDILVEFRFILPSSCFTEEKLVCFMPCQEGIAEVSRCRCRILCFLHCRRGVARVWRDKGFFKATYSFQTCFSVLLSLKCITTSRLSLASVQADMAVGAQAHIVVSSVMGRPCSPAINAISSHPSVSVQGAILGLGLGR